MKLLETIKNKDCIIKRHLEKDDILFRENDLCEYIGIVTNGRLMIVSYLENGKEVIYNEPKKDDIFGNNLIFSSNPYYRGDIIALQDSDIILIHKDNLIYLLKHNNDFLLEYLKIQSNFAKDLNNRIKLLAIDSAKERLKYYLHTNNNQISYDSVSSLAKNLYIQRETLSRVLTSLEKDKTILRKDRTIILLKEV